MFSSVFALTNSAPLFSFLPQFCLIFFKISSSFGFEPLLELYTKLLCFFFDISLDFFFKALRCQGTGPIHHACYLCKDVKTFELNMIAA